MTELSQVSRYLSYLLRHHPESIGLVLDEQGWASIAELIAKTTRFQLTREWLQVVVETNDKQRFSISEDGQRIRANQGHSIAVDLGLKPVSPPESLYHGTAVRFMVRIMREGLSKQQRHHVHLSVSTAVARAVGSRHGRPVILTIAAGQMAADGFTFYRTANNVWLVDHVPVSYISRLAEDSTSPTER